ncbi:MAG: Dam family site-specific DNA-(adenine-N6)-methyltransferase [Proteobacteria bacterium]|nr:Dam family site-specific DNA-(adenine-N6)-methyltransferase [Pseudomonadota bacterium]
MRWAGSKRQLVPTIRGLFPKNYERYLEPFAGSAAVFVAARPRRAVISDINPGLIEAYRVVRLEPGKVARQATRWPVSSDTYYRIRSIDPERLSSVGRAARFIYLNRYCFNGVYRENQQRRFNVPYGRTTGKMPRPAEFKAFAKLLKRARLVCCDFEETLRLAGKRDLVYVDPPYYAAGRVFKGEYGYAAFNSEDEDRLIAALTSAARRGAYLIVSYNGSLKARLPGWRAVRQRVIRNVGGFASKRKRIFEFIYTNIVADD